MSLPSWFVVALFLAICLLVYKTMWKKYGEKAQKPATHPDQDAKSEPEKPTNSPTPPRRRSPRSVQ